jgi:hypothetical protein
LALLGNLTQILKVLLHQAILFLAKIRAVKSRKKSTNYSDAKGIQLVLRPVDGLVLGITSCVLVLIRSSTTKVCVETWLALSGHETMCPVLLFSKKSMDVVL